jgi:hypothetical protein
MGMVVTAIAIENKAVERYATKRGEVHCRRHSL